ncbi:LuxR C-terminal-related transcriptional regulator [Nonomuraea sp. NPDC005650]|uniref:helix-turn-helix transcriptional regulator n=1 Tax=Nonomuraea sp. NPDC005650 TaxID=3157045 RepID=UPI0033A252D8
MTENASLALGLLADRNADALRHLARGLRVARDHGRNHMVPLLWLSGPEAAMPLIEPARRGQAKELFLSCGAPWLAAQVGVEQRRMAAHRPGAGGSLSEREREIAELVAYGLTNREIGERLFLSPRTVETHLASVFRKLGVKTRAALVHRLTG